MQEALPLYGADETFLKTLLADWNVYMAQTHFWHERVRSGQPMASRKLTPANREFLHKMVLWCAQHGVEPRLWLFHQFKGRGWRFPPKFDESCLMSEKALPKFRNLKAASLGFFRRRMAASKQSGLEVFDPNRDIATTVESLKSRFLERGSAEECMQATLTQTLGYHPKSVVCQSCPQAQPCSAALEALVPFPILALRAGRITAEEADRIATEKA